LRSLRNLFSKGLGYGLVSNYFIEASHEGQQTRLDENGLVFSARPFCGVPFEGTSARVMLHKINRGKFLWIPAFAGMTEVFGEVGLPRLSTSSQ